MTWYSVRATPAPTEREAVIGAFFALGTHAVQDLDDDVMTWFPAERERSDVRAALADVGFGGPITFADVVDVDWSSHWRDAFSVQEVGSIRVCPPWLAADATSLPVTVILEPGMAFGTGEHASTRCVLRLLQESVVGGERVADLGAGSAVLSIAAVLLGARDAVAIENDHDAIDNANQNVALNAVGERVIVLEGDAELMLPLVSPLDIVVANIISSVLVQLLPAIREALNEGGVAIFSGILEEESANFRESLARAGFNLFGESGEQGWRAFAART